MLFLLQSADGSTNATTSGEQLGALTLPQFRAAMATAKVGARVRVRGPEPRIRDPYI